MIFQAHKGVSTEYPENTMPAFLAAIEQGYKVIELDVRITKDNRFVLLHDTTINRTARNLDGTEIKNIIKISDIDYNDALNYDFGVWFSKKFNGTKITLLDDVLRLAKDNNVKLKIDNRYQLFSNAEKDAFFELLKPYEDIACLTCSNIDEIKNAYTFFPKMQFNYDGEITLETLMQLSEILPKEQLTIWAPIYNKDTSWVKVKFLDYELASLIKKYANLGVWIISNHNELKMSEKLGASIVETNGQLKPPLNKGMIVDMHTHSKYSHDSVCEITDMLKEQKKCGITTFAVTDHFDSNSFNSYDIFTPILNAKQEVKKINSEYNASILTGCEISEGFWHTEVYDSISQVNGFDVILGSVHLVKYKELTYAYSAIDFSKLTYETVCEYLDAYFDDMLTMIDTIDFDVLSHLTCPLRYITGKYNIDIDIACYYDKISDILRKIIEKGIALEVNTSSFESINDFMPSKNIIKKYYDMGGYLITLASDAHTPNIQATYFNKAINVLKEIGFNNIFYFKNRRTYQITI